LKPSRWVERWAEGFAQGATALDVACGSGRHLRWLTERGMRVTGVDHDAAATESLQGLAEIVTADIEAGPWPLGTRQFDLVIVTNYLWRPLFPTLVAAVAPGGRLLYETFAIGQQTVGRPARPAFLLQPGELLAACAGLRVVGYEDGFEAGRYVQRIAAVHEPTIADAYPRYRLAAE
jgi:SAM-dependent methyltransferase